MLWFAADAVRFSCDLAAKSAGFCVLLAAAAVLAASATTQTAADRLLCDSTATIHKTARPVPAFIRVQPCSQRRPHFAVTLTR